jgi:cation diffusion facilitator CzcD-associated flavoprotein CzcO
VPEAVVIGAGPGGLAAAAMLRRLGVDVVVVERSRRVANSWHGHYDRLHLHTVRWLSHLPGYKIPRRFGKWVARDDVVRYLEDYARHHRLDVRFGVSVDRIERTGDGWALRTSAGDLEAAYVVVAIGHNHTPVVPDWPGRDGFTGELVHASAYRNPGQYVGKDVLVVGSGNTGAEIAVDLVEGGAARVRLAVRTPPHIMLREAGGVPSLALGVLMRHAPTRLVDAASRLTQRLTIGDLSEHGLPAPKDGLYTRIKRDDQIPLIDVGFIERLKAGDVTVVPAVEAFDGADVLLADGSRIRPDAVIAATGYRRGLEPLVGHLGVLRADGRPRVHGARTDLAAPRMWFTGYTNPISGMFRELAIDARRIARAVAKERSGPRRADPGIGQLAALRRASAAAEREPVESA